MLRPEAQSQSFKHHPHLLTLTCPLLTPTLALRTRITTNCLANNPGWKSNSHLKVRETKPKSSFLILPTPETSFCPASPPQETALLCPTITHNPSPGHRAVSHLHLSNASTSRPLVPTLGYHQCPPGQSLLYRLIPSPTSAPSHTRSEQIFKSQIRSHTPGSLAPEAP